MVVSHQTDGDLEMVRPDVARIEFVEGAQLEIGGRVKVETGGEFDRGGIHFGGGVSLVAGEPVEFSLPIRDGTFRIDATTENPVSIQSPSSEILVVADHWWLERGARIEAGRVIARPFDKSQHVWFGGGGHEMTKQLRLDQAELDSIMANVFQVGDETSQLGPINLVGEAVVIDSERIGAVHLATPTESATSPVVAFRWPVSPSPQGSGS